MLTLSLLAVLYISFASLGLNDPIIGLCWTKAYADLSAPVGAAGWLSIGMTVGAVTVSFLLGHIVNRFGTGKTVAGCFTLSALSLVAVSFSPSFLFFLIFTVPLGFGTAGVDAAINNYFAVNGTSRQMNWGHGIWSAGAMLSPVIFTAAIEYLNWRAGFRIIAALQALLAVFLFLTLKVWTGRDNTSGKREKIEHPFEPLRDWRVTLGLALVFFFTAGQCLLTLWGKSYLIHQLGFAEAGASLCVSLYYFGLMGSRFLCGIVADRLGNSRIIRIGLIVAIAGTALLFVPVSGVMAAAFALIGFGQGPIYPCLAHETPRRFPTSQPALLIGYQYGFARVGGGLVPLIFGAAAQSAGFGSFPLFCFLTMALLFVFNLIVERSLSN